MVPPLIRPLEDADIPAVLDVVRQLQVHERQYYDRMKQPQEIDGKYVDHLKAECGKHDGAFLVAEIAGRVVGYAVVLGKIAYEDIDEIPYDYAYVNDLAVVEDLRGRGIGRKLLAACEAHARHTGVRWMRISVLAQNDQAKGLYRSFGFGDHLLELEKTLD